LAPALAMATVRQVMHLTHVPTAAIIPQQGTFLVPTSTTVCSHKGVVDYLIVRNLIAQAFFSWTESDANQTEPQHLVCIDGGALVKYNRRGYLEEMNILIFESLLVYCILLW